MPEHRVEVEGVLLACEDVGAGMPIVLLHGFPLDRAMWRAQIDALRPEFHVIAPDLRGFGRSMLGDGDVNSGVGMERYAADVLTLLDALGVSESIVLVGLSMGGYAALQAALRRPDRLRGLVLCDTRAAGDAEEAAAGRLKMADAALAAGDASPAMPMLTKLLASRTQERRPEIVAAVRSMIERQDPGAIAAAQRGMARREDVRSRLASIACPSLCIVGVDDAISSPEEMRAIADAMPDASLVEIDDAGHLSPMENPDAVAAAIREFALARSREA